MAMDAIVNVIRTKWASPRPVMHPRAKAPITLSCAMQIPGALRPGEDPGLGPAVPAPLLDFWRLARSARLFVDVQHGQWGLELGSPEEVGSWTQRFRRERARDARDGDLVVGRFLGDSDLLVVRADPAADDHGRVLVALPLDRRAEWYGVAEDLESFLVALERADGAKYWEP